VILLITDYYILLTEIVLVAHLAPLCAHSA